MTNDQHNDDAFEQRARIAGAALRRPAPADGIARLQSIRRRQQIVRTSIAAGASAIIVIVGLVVLNRPADRAIKPANSPVPSTTLVPSTSTAPTTTSVPASPTLPYTLMGIDGVRAIDDPVAVDAGGATWLVVAWSGPTGITDGVVVLNESRDVIGATEPEGEVTSVPIDVPDGRAYLVTDNGVDGQPLASPSNTRLMWWRDDGRLWIASNFEVTPERLTRLTLAIQPGSGLPYVLPEAGTEFVGFSTSDSYESVRQGWSMGGSSLTLAVTTGGLAQQLADVTAVSVAERTIAGAAGYAFTLPNGQVNLAWPTAHPDQWGSLLISPPLVPRLDEIAAAITPI
ncbi:MAG: hypothetical protein ABI894_10480 [Ilumatobacteraceae bacterium]